MEKIIFSTAKEILKKIAAQNALLTIIPTLQDGVLSFGVDSLSKQSLNNIIQDVAQRK